MYTHLEGGTGGPGGPRPPIFFGFIFSKNFKNEQIFPKIYFFLSSRAPHKNLLPPPLIYRPRETHSHNLLVCNYLYIPPTQSVGSNPKVANSELL